MWTRAHMRAQSRVKLLKIFSHTPSGEIRMRGRWEHRTVRWHHTFKIPKARPWRHPLKRKKSETKQREKERERVGEGGSDTPTTSDALPIKALAVEVWERGTEERRRLKRAKEQRDYLFLSFSFLLRHQCDKYTHFPHWDSVWGRSAWPRCSTQTHQCNCSCASLSGPDTRLTHALTSRAQHTGECLRGDVCHWRPPPPDQVLNGTWTEMCPWRFLWMWLRSYVKCVFLVWQVCVEPWERVGETRGSALIGWAAGEVRWGEVRRGRGRGRQDLRATDCPLSRSTRVSSCLCPH